jgi:hypothetical protein
VSCSNVVHALALAWRRSSRASISCDPVMAAQ